MRLKHYEWIFVITGKPIDLLLCPLLLLLVPGVFWWYVFGPPGEWRRLLWYAYLIIDGLLLLRWGSIASAKKDLRDHPPQEEYEKSIEELRQRLEMYFPSGEDGKKKEGKEEEQNDS